MRHSFFLETPLLPKTSCQALTYDILNLPLSSTAGLLIPCLLWPQMSDTFNTANCLGFKPRQCSIRSVLLSSVPRIKNYFYSYFQWGQQEFIQENNVIPPTSKETHSYHMSMITSQFIFFRLRLYHLTDTFLKSFSSL